MSAQPTPPAMQEAQPLFEHDVLCLRCGYNLRGIVEPRCPECGFVFDPREVLSQCRGELPLPSLRWAIWNVWRHPIGFWALPQVRFARSPGLSYLLGIICLVASTPAPVLLAYLLARRGPDAVPAAALLIPATFAGVAFALFLLAPLHLSLCNIVLFEKQMGHPDRGAEMLMVYPTAWAAPVVLHACGKAALAGVAPAGLPHAPVQAVLSGGLLVCVAFWAACLFAGGYCMSGGRIGAGIWCAAANPAWVILVAVLWLMF